jgi:hypothetical protein
MFTRETTAARPFGSALEPGPTYTWLWVLLLLIAHASLAILGVVGRSVTSDETAHLTAGYAYWKFSDFRLQPENGNLPQRWGALPLLAAKPHLEPKDDPIEWRISSVWNIAQKFLFERGNNTDFLLLCSRATMLVWSLLGGLLVFGWTRAIWGSTAGLLSLALFCFSPTTLAHGPLVTSDMCAAVCLLAASAGCWRMCLQPDPTRVVLFGILTGFAFVAKFSAALLLPVFLLIFGATWAAARSSAETRRPSWTATRVLAGFGVSMLISGAVIWLFFGMRFDAVSQTTADFDHFYLPWETINSGEHLWSHGVSLIRKLRLLPEAYLYGFSFVMYFSAQRGAFLLGEFSSTGWWWFFPFAFAVKSTVGELLIATVLAIRGVVAARSLRFSGWQGELRSPLWPLLLFAVVYGAFSLTTKLNIGQRHILPLYLVLFILAGGLFARKATRALKSVALLGLALGAAETIGNNPNHLAFFNRLAGGPENGWHLLVDSSLDWGQDVAPLGRWIQANRRADEPVYVSCFGTADPFYEGTRGQVLAPYYSLGRARRWHELQPGLYCISATMLQDVYGIRPGPWTVQLEKDYQYLTRSAKIAIPTKAWDETIPQYGFHPEHPLWLLDRLRFARLCQYLKVRKPDAVINHTQFVYRLSEAEIETFSNKPYSALVELMGAWVQNAP